MVFFLLFRVLLTYDENIGLPCKSGENMLHSLKWVTAALHACVLSYAALMSNYPHESILCLPLNCLPVSDSVCRGDLMCVGRLIRWGNVSHCRCYGEGAAGMKKCRRRCTHKTRSDWDRIGGSVEVPHWEAVLCASVARILLCFWLRATWLIFTPLLKVRIRRTISYCYWHVLGSWRRLLSQNTHVLHSYLPDRPIIVYAVRTRSHNKSLICKSSDLNDRNFLVRAVYKDRY